MNPFEGDAVLLWWRGFSKQLQQSVAVIKIHVLLDAVLLAERQQHVGAASCSGNTVDNAFHTSVRDKKLSDVSKLVHRRLSVQRTALIPTKTSVCGSVYKLNHMSVVLSVPMFLLMCVQVCLDFSEWLSTWIRCLHKRLDLVSDSGFHPQFCGHFSVSTKVSWRKIQILMLPDRQYSWSITFWKPRLHVNLHRKLKCPLHVGS